MWTCILYIKEVLLVTQCMNIIQIFSFFKFWDWILEMQSEVSLNEVLVLHFISI